MPSFPSLPHKPWLNYRPGHCLRQDKARASLYHLCFLRHSLYEEHKPETSLEKCEDYQIKELKDILEGENGGAEKV